MSWISRVFGDFDVLEGETHAEELTAEKLDAYVLKNTAGHQRPNISADAFVYKDSGVVIAVDKFGNTLDYGPAGDGGVDARVIMSALNSVAADFNGGWVACQGDERWYFGQEVEIPRFTGLSIPRAQVLPGADVNMIFFRRNTTLWAPGTYFRTGFFTGYTGDVFVLDTARVGADYFIEQKDTVRVLGYPILEGTQGEGVGLALRAKTQRIDGGFIGRLFTEGFESGVLFDTSGSYINANRVYGQFRNANQNIHHTGSNQATSIIEGDIGYGGYGIRNETTQASVRWEGQVFDPMDFTQDIFVGPGLVIRHKGQDAVRSVATSGDAWWGTYLVDASGGAVTMTLAPASYRSGVTVKRTDGSANTVTVQQDAAGETIDGASSLTLPNQYDSITVESDGSDWHITEDTR